MRLVVTVFLFAMCATPLSGQEIGDLVRYKVSGDFSEDWRTGIWGGQAPDKNVDLGTVTLTSEQLRAAEYLNERPWMHDALGIVAGSVALAVFFGKFPLGESRLTGQQTALFAGVISFAFIGGHSIARAISPRVRGKWEPIPFERWIGFTIGVYAVGWIIWENWYWWATPDLARWDVIPKAVVPALGAGWVSFPITFQRR